MEIAGSARHESISTVFTGYLDRERQIPAVDVEAQDPDANVRVSLSAEGGCVRLKQEGLCLGAVSLDTIARNVASELSSANFRFNPRELRSASADEFTIWIQRPKKQESILLVHKGIQNTSGCDLSFEYTLELVVGNTAYISAITVDNDTDVTAAKNILQSAPSSGDNVTFGAALGCSVVVRRTSRANTCISRSHVVLQCASSDSIDISMYSSLRGDSTLEQTSIIASDTEVANGGIVFGVQTSVGISESQMLPWLATASDI